MGEISQANAKETVEYGLIWNRPHPSFYSEKHGKVGGGMIYRQERKTMFESTKSNKVMQGRERQEGISGERQEGISGDRGPPPSYVISGDSMTYEGGGGVTRSDMGPRNSEGLHGKKAESDKGGGELLASGSNSEVDASELTDLQQWHQEKIREEQFEEQLLGLKSLQGIDCVVASLPHLDPANVASVIAQLPHACQRRVICEPETKGIFEKRVEGLQMRMALNPVPKPLTPLVSANRKEVWGMTADAKKQRILAKALDEVMRGQFVVRRKIKYEQDRVRQTGAYATTPQMQQPPGRHPLTPGR